jgi:hypothetical protein
MNFIHVPELDVNPPLSPGSVPARQNRQAIRFGFMSAARMRPVPNEAREG